MTAAQDLFFLAHYTYNVINPLMQEAQTIEPSVVLTLDTIFAHSEAPYSKDHRVEAHLHWKREGMFALSSGLRNKADVDKFAEVLRGKIDKLKLEARQASKRELYAAAYSN